MLYSPKKTHTQKNSKITCVLTPRMIRPGSLTPRMIRGGNFTPPWKLVKILADPKKKLHTCFRAKFIVRNQKAKNSNKSLMIY